MTDRALSKVRNLSYLLHPPLLDESGLLPALHWYLGGIEKRSELRIKFSHRPSAFPRLSRELETAIFRVIQEALTNAYRHSGSQDARVELNLESEQVIIRVRDFGKGVSPGTLNTGVGVSSMKERVKQLNGELKVSRTEPGTLVEAFIPILDSSVMNIGMI
jgi:signal transduction histidine kinase